LTRTPKALPTMRINPQVKDIFSFKYEDFELVGYEADSSIKAPIAV
jgi:thymidylate synthase